MSEAITVMENMFRDLATGHILQPLRSLLWLPDRSGLLGMMPAHATIHPTANPETIHPTANNAETTSSIIGVKLITIFHQNTNQPSHQGIIVLFDGANGAPLMLFDAEEITAIRTAAASAVATNLLAIKDASTLAILGGGEQAIRHLESIPLVRPINHINLWSRNKEKAEQIANRIHFSQTEDHPRESHKAAHPAIDIADSPRQATEGADIICTVTASTQPILQGNWLKPGAHLNVIGSCTPNAREVDTQTIEKAKLFTDRYESLFKEAGDFLIPKAEGRITDNHVKAEIGEVLTKAKPGRENPADITCFKSLGIAAEDLYSAHHIYKKLR
jgi:ornithine cyclodeaminase